jgi:hypothetical protein
MASRALRSSSSSLSEPLFFLLHLPLPPQLSLSSYPRLEPNNSPLSLLREACHGDTHPPGSPGIGFTSVAVRPAVRGAIPAAAIACGCGVGNLAAARSRLPFGYHASGPVLRIVRPGSVVAELQVLDVHRSRDLLSRQSPEPAPPRVEGAPTSGYGPRSAGSSEMLFEACHPRITSTQQAAARARSIACARSVGGGGFSGAGRSGARNSERTA